MEENKFIYIKYLEHHIVNHCNLKCNGCSHFSGLADEWYEDIEDFKKDFKRLKEITNGQVGTIRIMGGEPLLHPYVLDFLIYTRELFPSTQIQIVTNGILLKKIYNIADVCNQYNIICCVSNYDINLDLQKILLKFRYKRIDQKMNMYNISLDLNGSQNSEDSFNFCDLHRNWWLFFQNGRLYHCCIGANIKIYNKYFNRDLPSPSGISIYSSTAEEIVEYLTKPNELCRFCNTRKREKSYHKFSISKKEEKEWICQ